MSKESKQLADKGLIFRETFNSEQEVIRNGGTIVGGTIENGTVSYGDGIINSYIHYNKHLPKGAYTVRVRLKYWNKGAYKYFLTTYDGSVSTSDWSCRTYNVSTELDIGGTQGSEKLYVNGVETNVMDSGYDQEFVFTFTTSVYRSSFRLFNYANGNGLGGSEIEFLEIYNYAWTAEEVANAYENKRFRDLPVNKVAQGDGTILNGASPCENMSNPTFQFDQFTAIGNYGFDAYTDGNGNENCGTSEEINITLGTRYLVTFDCTVNTGSDVIGDIRHNISSAVGGSGRTLEGSQTIREGYNSHTFTASQNEAATALSFSAVNLGSACDFEIRNIKVQELVVEPTQEILNVNAQSGSVVNKYAGDVYGDELCGDPFMDGLSWWTLGGTTTISGGKANLASVPNGSYAFYRTSLVTIGKIYRVQYTVSNYSAGTFQMKCGTAGGTTISANGTYIDDIVCAGNTTFTTYCTGTTTLSVDDVSIKEVISEPTLTDVDVVKDGDIQVMKFNGSTSKIDCGDYDDLTGDKTFLFWLKPDGRASITISKLIDNEEFFVNYYPLSLYGNRYIAFTSDGSTIVSSAGGLLTMEHNEWAFLVIVRASYGNSDVYLNGAVVSALTDKDSGTPTAGTSNLYIGNREDGARPFGGYINTRIVDGLLTAEEISQIFSSEKHLYNK